MKKLLPHIGIFAVLIGLFVPLYGVNAQAASMIFGGFTDLVGTLLSPIGYALMSLTALLTSLGGLLLNAVVYHTIIQMAQTFSDVEAIDTAWTVLRDLANMTFIFVILYAAINLIIGQGKDTQRLIVNMIIAAILINFSLFFTKVIIDVANLLALTFYNAIAPGASSDFATAGMANAITDSLRITTLYNASGDISGTNVFTISIMSSIVFLITAFVFFAIAVMLIIRYVVLIFLLILSPLMFVSMILPKLQGYTKKWWNALLGQAFFAPIYFLLTWVTVLVVRGISSSIFETAGTVGSFADALRGASGSMPIIINFLVIIVFLVASLVIAKDIASQAGPQVSNLTKWAMGAAGGVTFGAAGKLGRSTLGTAGSAIADSEKLKKMDEKGGFAGAAARLTLAAGRKGAKASFDARSSGVYESISGATGTSFGKGTGKGGYNQLVKDKAKKEKELADTLKPSDLVVNAAERELDEAKKGTDKGRIAKAQAKVDELKGVSEDEAKNRKVKEIQEASNWTMTEKEAKQELGKRQLAWARKVKEFRDADPNLNQKQAEEKLKQDIEDEIKSLTNGGMDPKKAREKVEGDLGFKPETIKSEATKRKEAYADRLMNPNLKDFKWVKDSPLNKVVFVSKANKQAAMEIRKSIKEKKPADKLAEELSKAKEAGEDGAASSTPSTSSSPAPSGGSSSGSGGTPTP